MTNKIYLKELAKSLRFDLDDNQIDQIAVLINDIDGMIQHAKSVVNPNISPANYPKVKNCAKLRRDIPVENTQKNNYLANAKVADKYVVGK